MQVEPDNNEEDTLRLKTKRPRITLEPYDDERKIEVVHDDGQEIYEPVPSVSEKFLQLVRKVREQQQEQQTQQQKQQQEDQKAEETPAVIKNDRPIAHYLHLARAEVEFMGHTLDMIKDGLFMLPHATKAQSLASIQATEIATQLEGKKAVLVRAADRIRNAAHALEETIAKDHEGYLPSLLALRSRWRLHSTSTPTPYGIQMKVAVDYGHSTVGGPALTLSTGELPEASIIRSKEDGSLELSFKKTHDVDLHLALSYPRGGRGKEDGGKELVLSARSLSSVGVESINDAEKGADRKAKLAKNVKRLVRAHECQFNEELFQKLVSETEIKDNRRTSRARFIEESIQIDSGHFGSGACLTIRKGSETIYSHNNPPPPPLHQLHSSQVILIAARRIYLAQCLHSAQQMQTLTSRSIQPSSFPYVSPSPNAPMSVLSGICDIFLHIDMRSDVMQTLDKMAETYPIAIHWTCHGLSKSSCVVRNSHYSSSSSHFHSLFNSNSPSQDSNNNNDTPTNNANGNTHNNHNTNYHNNNNNNSNISNYNNSYINTHTVDGVVVVYVDGRDITCTIPSSTLRVVHPRELVHFIKNYFRFL